VFRNPTTQAQYINLDVVTSRLLGGLPQCAQQYDIMNNTYTIFSVMDFSQNLVENGEVNTSLLVPFDFWRPVKPERIQVFEVGYRSVINSKIMIDVNYYRNIYKDFITQVQARQVQNSEGQPVSLESNTNAYISLLNGTANNTDSIYTNVNQTVYSQGAAAGVDYLLPKGYKLSGNYSWNKLDESSLPDDYLNDYN